MSDGFNVLKCFNCHVFQVHMTKKSNTWQCKLCSEKQSCIKVYANGSAADCRKHVQKLNLISGCQERRKENSLLEEVEVEQSEGIDMSDPDTYTGQFPNLIAKRAIEETETLQKFRFNVRATVNDEQNARKSENEAQTGSERPKTVFPSVHNTPMTSKWFKYLKTNVNDSY